MTLADQPVCFASFFDFSCSICAPDTMTGDEVVAFANVFHAAPRGRSWEAVDKSKLGLGSPTPNPCNQVAGRRHWFLLVSYD
jgi:hypothetical protein